MSVLGSRRVSCHASVGALIVLALCLPGTGASAASSGPSTGALPAGHVFDPCTGAREPSTFSGTLTVEGGSLPSSAVANISLSYSYDLQSTTVEEPTGEVLSIVCSLTYGSIETNATGAFEFSITPPAETCQTSGGVELCTTYAAPFAPVSVNVTSAPPPAYALSVTRSGSSFALVWVAELASLSLTPPGAVVTVSNGAPATFAATPKMANGSVSPLRPTYDWALTGAGWTFLDAAGNGSATVIAAPNAAVGTVSVSASVTVSTTELTTPTVSVELVAVPTTVESGEVNRTVVDAGETVAMVLSATGAGGYSYRTTIVPGLAGETATATCTTTPASSGTVSVRCEANVTYPGAGTAQPVANVSNGFSSGGWSFAEVTVDPPPALSLVPSTPTGYAGTSLSVVLVAAAGSGAVPYRGACFASGDGTVSCSNAPGPSWGFSLTYPQVGNYSALGWAVDADGTNRSIDVPVRIVAPLAVGPLVAAGTNFSAGTAVVVEGNLTGGDLPARVWWNASDLSGPIAVGSASSDGPISVDFVPPTAGTVRLSFTAVDSLGTVAESVLVVSVGPGLATSIATVAAPPAGPVVVGTPVSLTWQAFDPVGDPVRSFAAPAELSLTLTPSGSPATAWVNASGTGALSRGPNGSFAVPSAAWVGGFLNISVTVALNGSVLVRLHGPALPGPVPAVELLAVPDLSHLRLYDPVVAAAGGRTNHTFWHVRDPFGNPVPGAFVVVEYLFGSSASDVLVPVEGTDPGPTGVWVNYTAPGDSSGTVRVLDPSGAVILGPIEIPSASRGPGESASVVTLGAAIPVGVSGALISTVLHRRARRRPAPDDEALRRLAEGRAQVVEIVRTAGSADLSAIAAAWEPATPPDELADWVASLVADGTLGAEVGGDGVARFRLVDRLLPGPRVTVDRVALERAVALREAVAAEDEEGPI